MADNKNFQYYLSKFLLDEMSSIRNNSSNTIASYSDSFKLFLIYMEEEKGIKPNLISLDDLTKDNVHNYLNWLEDVRKVCIPSRNVRLAAIHSFVRYLQSNDPSRLFEYQRILSIKKKKGDGKTIEWLTKQQLLTFFDCIDSKTKEGLRNKTLLTLLYDGGLRVDELINLKYSDLRLTRPETVNVKGKGSKIRSIPLMGNTVELIKKYIKEYHIEEKQYSSCEYLFFNRSNNKLTRAGISYIIGKYTKLANDSGANITIKTHPHLLRHSKAVHLLEAGVNLIYIRDFLGHNSVKTTEIYAKVNNADKRKYLEQVYEDVATVGDDDWTNNDDLMAFLNKISNSNKRK